VIRPPSTIRITSRITYNVVYSDIINDDPSFEGLCDADTHTIFIRSNLTPRQKFSTFLHEVIHAISYHNPGPTITEKQTLKLEAGIDKVLRLNGYYD